jgi:membrane protein YdbS with pleckstrin-like domain
VQFFGSNPHSNGDHFSRSSLIFFEINVANIIMTDDNMMVIVAAIVIIIIYPVFHKFLDWKSSILSSTR